MVTQGEILVADPVLTPIGTWNVYLGVCCMFFLGFSFPILNRISFGFLILIDNSIIAEKIRRKDQEVARALEEKHRLVAEYYHLPFDDELNPPATPISAGPMSAAASIDEVTSGGERDAREVLLAALVQGQLQVQRAKMLVFEQLVYMYY